MSKFVVTGDPDTREVTRVLGPVVGPTQHSPTVVSWAVAFTEAEEGERAVVWDTDLNGSPPEPGDVLDSVPVTNEDDYPSLDRAKEIIQTLRQRISDLEDIVEQHHG